MARTVVVRVFDAMGGPPEASMGEDGFIAGPTDKGQYVVAYCGPHVSHRYREWSAIAWGTPLKEKDGQIWVQVSAARKGGRVSRRRTDWVPLSRFTTVTREEILDYHFQLYRKRIVPRTWVFNDFGHATCYVFKDVDGNRRLNAGESIHGEFFHTTPTNEAQAARGRPVVLTESHGCIHVKPADIDIMRRKGYMARGNLVFIHRYADELPRFALERGDPPFELHFYPGESKVLVKGRAH